MQPTRSEFSNYLSDSHLAPFHYLTKHSDSAVLREQFYRAILRKIFKNFKHLGQKIRYEYKRHHSTMLLPAETRSSFARGKHKSLAKSESKKEQTSHPAKAMISSSAKNEQQPESRGQESTYRAGAGTGEGAALHTSPGKVGLGEALGQEQA